MARKLPDRLWASSGEAGRVGPNGAVRTARRPLVAPIVECCEVRARRCLGRMDRALAALVAAAEEGTPCPVIKLFVAGGFIAARVPARSAEFFRANQIAVEEAYRAGLPRRSLSRRRKHEAEDARSAALESVEDALVLLTAHGAPAENPSAYSGWRRGMERCRRRLELPALRIPLDAITGWWLEGEKPSRAITPRADGSPAS